MHITEDELREIKRYAGEGQFDMIYALGYRKGKGRAEDWNPLLPFDVTVKEGSRDTGPPFLEVTEYPTLDDGRQVTVYLVPEYEQSYRTSEGYSACFEHAEELRDKLNELIAKIGISAYRVD